MTFLVAVLLKPFGALLIFLPALCLRILVVRFMPECRFKDELLRERFESHASSSNRRIWRKGPR